jgi:hypothetical protein
VEQGTGYERQVIGWPALGCEESENQKQGDSDTRHQSPKTAGWKNSLPLTKADGEKTAAGSSDVGPRKTDIRQAFVIQAIQPNLA